MYATDEGDGSGRAKKGAGNSNRDELPKIGPDRAHTVDVQPLPSGAVLLTLGRPEEGPVILTKDRLFSIEAAVAQAADMRPRGLIIMGSGVDMFSVGADVQAIAAVTDAELGETLARKGQRIFDRVSSLPFPTIAAISGPCVGGGFELALACTFRICSDATSTLIGLPEVKIGLLPGFGGTQRLPRLIGLPKALELILQGKTLRARQAVRYGLVSEAVPYAHLKERADAIVVGLSTTREPRLGMKDRFLTFTTMGRKLVQNRALGKLAATRAIYPAPPAALAATIFGLERGIVMGLDNEAKELGRLIVTPQCKSLVRLFLLSEKAKAIGKAGRKEAENRHAVVIGAGTMGAGIAAALARSEVPVLLKDTDDRQLETAVGRVREEVARLSYLSDTERSFILNRIETSSRDSASIGNVNLVIEAGPEKLELKKKLLSRIAELLPLDAIIATNTSSLSVTEIASAVPHPERVVGLHFFNPVAKMPLVEIVRGELTSVKTIVIAAAIANRLGKFPVIVEDVPGFLVNRILTPYLNAAALLLAKGYRVATVDEAATSFGMPMGPLRLLDEVGLDVASHVAEVVRKGYGERMDCPQFLQALLTAGRKGRKSGGGFYEYRGSDAVPFGELNLVLGTPERPADPLSLRELQDGLIATMINEAVRCLDEGVAGAPGKDAADQIDLATVMGIGFPPFLGGMLHYGDKIGAPAVKDALVRMKDRVGGEMFTPSPPLLTRIEEGRPFAS